MLSRLPVVAAAGTTTKEKKKKRASVDDEKLVARDRRQIGAPLKGCRPVVHEFIFSTTHDRVEHLKNSKS